MVVEGEEKSGPVLVAGTSDRRARPNAEAENRNMSGTVGSLQRKIRQALTPDQAAFRHMMRRNCCCLCLLGERLRILLALRAKSNTVTVALVVAMWVLTQEDLGCLG